MALRREVNAFRSVYGDNDPRHPLGVSWIIGMEKKHLTDPMSIVQVTLPMFQVLEVSEKVEPVESGHIIILLITFYSSFF